MKTKKTSMLFLYLAGIGIGVLGNRFFQRNRKEKGQNKWVAYYHILNNWMKLKESGGSLEQRLSEKNIESVAIYGMGDIGRHLVKDLENSNIEVKYAIDQSFFAISDIDVYEPESDLPDVDAVIITPVCEYENICKNISKKTKAEILSVADIVSVK